MWCSLGSHPSALRSAIQRGLSDGFCYWPFAAGLSGVRSAPFGPAVGGGVLMVRILTSWAILIGLLWGGYSAWTRWENPWRVGSPVLFNLPAMSDDCLKKGCAP
jgi:hypothetical protein